MTNGWIFQANPKHYDIDAALEELGQIDWRVPQYASEIAVNDPVVIWRAGKDAGIIALARVLTPPSQMTQQPREDDFTRTGTEGAETTRVTISVRAVPFVGKSQVSEDAVLGSHQIVTGPMGTVFPVDAEQFGLLLDLIGTEPPPKIASASDHLPTPFAWSERYKAVLPLPGGVGDYQRTLGQILAHVAEHHPPLDDLGKWMEEQFDISTHRQSNTTNFLRRISLLRSTGALVEVTDEGARWLQGRDDLFLLALIHSRIRFVGEMLRAVADGASTPNDLLSHANEHYGTGWSTRAQIDRRRYILEATGVIEVGEDGGLEPTEQGRAALATLELHPPLAHRTDPLSRATADEAPARAPLVELEAPQGDSPDPGLHELVDRLQRSAHDGKNPDDFEQAARDAFDRLGFQAKWLGGAGRTDVLLAADLGMDHSYRVIVDTKATSHDAVPDQQINWPTLEEHREVHEADYVLLVAARFRSARLTARALERSIGLLEVPDLVSLLRQHEQVPLGLDDYRHLFEPEGIAKVNEIAEEQRRDLVLAARILGVLHREQHQEGPLEAGDLYWLLKQDEDDEFEAPSRDELAELLVAMAARPFQLLKRHAEGYLTIGSIRTATERLRVMADLIATNEV